MTLTRRDFLRRTAAVATGLAVAPVATLLPSEPALDLTPITGEQLCQIVEEFYAKRIMDHFVGGSSEYDATAVGSCRSVTGLTT